MPQGMEDNVYAVIDTNVIVSALISRHPEAAPFNVLAHVFAGVITPLYNEDIITEYREVLSREKFHLNPQDVESALTVILAFGLNLERTAANDETFIDPKDIVFYEVTMSKEDAYLVTGNTKHYPKKPFVVTPRKMLEIISQRHTETESGV